MYCQEDIQWHKRVLSKRALTGFVFGLVSGLTWYMMPAVTLVLGLIGFFLCYDKRDERFGFSGILVNATFFFAALVTSGLGLLYAMIF